MHTASITEAEHRTRGAIAAALPATAAYRDWLTLQDMSPCTIDQRCKFMATRLAHWGTLDLPASFVVEWLREYDGWTRRTYQGHLASIYAFLVEAGELEVSPIAKMRAAPEPESRPSPVPRQQLGAVLSSAHGDLRAWLLLGYLAGLRSFEIAKFQGEHIDRTTLIVLGKGNRLAEIPTHPDLWQLALTYPRTGPWFPSPHRARTHISSSTVGQKVRVHLRAHGIDTGSIHRLRHSCLTDLSRNGVSVRVVQEIARHKSLAHTQRYIEASSVERAMGVRTLQVASLASR